MLLAVCFAPYFMIANGMDKSIHEIPPWNYQLEFVLILVTAAIELLLSISMIYIFVRRLYSLVLMQTVHYYEESRKSVPGFSFRSTMSVSGAGAVGTMIPPLTPHFGTPPQFGTPPPDSVTELIIEDEQLEPRNLAMSFLERREYRKLIGLSVKIIVLAIVSMISSCVLMALRAVCFNFIVSYEMSKTLEIWIQLDTMISCVCLTLFLPRTQRGFDILCGCCNAILSRCMRKSLELSTACSLREIEESRAVTQTPSVRL